MTDSPPARPPFAQRARVLAERASGVSTELQLLLGVAALYGIFGILYSSTFVTTDNTANMARQGGILLVVAIGEMFALLVGGFDISVAATMGFSATLVAMAMVQWEYGIAESVLIALAAGAGVGLVNGVLISMLRISPLIVTLGMATFLLGLGNELTSGEPVFGLPSGFQYLGATDWGPIPSTIGIGLIVCIAAGLLLTRTRAGVYLYALGGSRETCRLSGILVFRYEILAYTICGLLAALAGVMIASRTTVGQPSLGANYELVAIAAAVIGGVAIGGGVGRLSGVVLGVALITILNTGLGVAEVEEFIQRMVTGVVLVAAVLASLLRGTSLRDISQTFRLGSTGMGKERRAAT